MVLQLLLTALEFSVASDKRRIRRNFAPAEQKTPFLYGKELRVCLHHNLPMKS